MCGICGIHDPKKRIDEELIKKMSKVLRHRGPDDEGYFLGSEIAFGFRRLSIIDLVTGNQPMCNEDESIWIVYNGETYNFPLIRRELEKKGHRFKSRSDTETIIHGYEEWDIDVLKRLNGMFAFALWDERKKRLFLARDRLGIKPLYFRLEGDKLIFASEIKALIQDHNFRRRVNLRALIDYLTFQNVFGRKTFFNGIEKLLPGHYAIKDDDGLRIFEYWDLDFSKGPIYSEEYYIKKYQNLLRRSVRMELISDVPVGFHLSGGIDSSSVAVSAKGEVDKFRTFSGSFPEEGFDESPFADRVARILRAERHKISLHPEDVPKMLAKMIYHLDEPRVGPGSIPQYYVARLASNHVKVVLTGHGGDELFAGYPSYLYPHLLEIIASRERGRQLFMVLRDLNARSSIEGWKRTIGLPLYTSLNQDLKKYGRDSVFKPGEIVKLLRPQVRRCVGNYSTRKILDGYRAKKLTPLERLQYIDIKTYLPSLLDNEDRLSMAFSLESRVPILDHTIAEFSTSIPSLYKVEGLTLKNIPRKAARNLIPKEVIEHKKMGFPVPISTWLRNGLGEYARNILLSDVSRTRSFFDGRYVELLLEEHSLGVGDHSEKIWCLLSFELWNRVFMDEDATLPVER